MTAPSVQTSDGQTDVRTDVGMNRSPWQTVVRRFLQHRLAVIGLLVLLVLIVGAAAAPLISPHDPLKTGLAMSRSAPTEKNPLGVDAVGRDLLSRLIYGARVSLVVAIGVVAIQVSIGIVIGLTSGYFGGVTDGILMRIADIVLSFPQFVVVVATVSVIGPGITNVVLVLGLLGWPRIARLVRSQTLALRSYTFVEAAVAIGGRDWRILLVHILPNALPSVVVAATFGVARAVLLEAGLSFLGMGVEPPTPSWGSLLAEAQSLVVLESMPWVWIPPGLCLMALVMAVNFVGDGLRDALDPYTILRVKD